MIAGMGSFFTRHRCRNSTRARSNRDCVGRCSTPHTPIPNRSETGFEARAAARRRKAFLSPFC